MVCSASRPCAIAPLAWTVTAPPRPPCLVRAAAKTPRDSHSRPGCVRVTSGAPATAGAAGAARSWAPPFPAGPADAANTATRPEPGAGQDLIAETTGVMAGRPAARTAVRAAGRVIHATPNSAASASITSPSSTKRLAMRPLTAHPSAGRVRALATASRQPVRDGLAEARKDAHAGDPRGSSRRVPGRLGRPGRPGVARAELRRRLPRPPGPNAG